MFRFIKHKNFNNQPEELILELARLRSERDETAFINLYNKNVVVIKSHFLEWKKVPNVIRAAPLERQENFLQTLYSLASLYQKAGDGSLMALLVDTTSNNPIIRWRENIAKAQELSGEGKFEESKQLLLVTIPEIETSEGNVREAYLAKACGHLGAVYCYLGDYKAAAMNTHKALLLCREFNDLEGIASYSGNMIELMKRMGVREEGDHLMKERVATLRQLGRLEEAIQYESMFND